MFIQALLTLIYGIIIAAGGIIGYLMAKSLPSLISGGILGIAAIAGSILMFMEKPIGKPIAIIAAILIGLFFGFQLLKGLSAGTAVARAAGIFTFSVIELMVLLLIKGTQSTPK
jgi:uncharacterized membrane protein (UPF0136 family)